LRDRRPQTDTRYTYTVTVKHELWGSGVRWDWDPELQGLVQRDRVYRHEFRTLPDPRTQLDRPFSFIVIGDFGTAFASHRHRGGVSSKWRRHSSAPLTSTTSASC
jgi:hypothetical protein